jgi:hypothetical protein
MIAKLPFAYDPAIHDFLAYAPKNVDARQKAGHDERKERLRRTANP